MGHARGEAFWAKLAREVEAGGTRVEVAHRYGVTVSALGYWVGRLRRTKPVATLLPVRVESEPRRRVEIVTGEIRIVVEEGTDPAFIVELVRALRAC